MADEEIPEKVDLTFLAKQGKQVLAELRDMRADNQERDKKLDKIANDVSELQITMAATHADIGVIKQGVEDQSERLQTVEGRLNTVDSRLARIEKHTGLVKA